jgi:hypothetical protein
MIKSIYELFEREIDIITYMLGYTIHGERIYGLLVIFSFSIYLNT